MCVKNSFVVEMIFTHSLKPKFILLLVTEIEDGTNLRGQAAAVLNDTLKTLSETEKEQLWETMNSSTKYKLKQFIGQIIDTTDEDIGCNIRQTVGIIAGIELLSDGNSAIFDALVQSADLLSSSAVEQRLNSLGYLIEECSTSPWIIRMNGKIVETILCGIQHDNLDVKRQATVSLHNCLKFMQPYFNATIRENIIQELSKLASCQSTEIKENVIECLVMLARYKGEVMNTTTDEVVDTFKQLSCISPLDIEIIQQLDDWRPFVDNAYTTAKDLLTKTHNIHKKLSEEDTTYRQARLILEEKSPCILLAIRVRMTISLLELCQDMFITTDSIHIRALTDWCLTKSVIRLSSDIDNIIQVSYIAPPPKPDGLQLGIPAFRKKIIKLHETDQVLVQFAGTNRVCTRFALTSQSEYLREQLSTVSTFKFESINDDNMNEFNLLLDLLHKGEILVTVKQLTIMYCMSIHFKLTQVELSCQHLLEEEFHNFESFFTIWKYIEKPKGKEFVHSVFFKMIQFIDQNTMRVTAWLATLRRSGYKTSMDITEDIGEANAKDIKHRVRNALDKINMFFELA
jgi:hypothetical protein